MAECETLIPARILDSSASGQRDRDVTERAEFCEITGGHEPMPEDPNLSAKCLAPLNR
jgi:hypothetical protein